ncbi:GH19592 [Drosophila grimshawi]|uniref:U3 small nucleolar RNA-associated protein 15 homolog n=1 Tax=Drosophila grimshawi TaxID=7222 RepID=B4JHT2_DROGR|nr:GH19592 [Drosophila grimshawi]
MTSNFQPLHIQRFQQKVQLVTPDTTYWNRLDKSELLKEHSNVDYIDFSPSEQDNFVLTCSARVQIYHLVTKLVVKNLSKFQKTAYGATFRQDGRLLAAGDEEGYVKLFDISSRNILRLFKGHTAPVHRTFFTADKSQLASFADDKSVRLWDVGNEKLVRTYEDAHSDYIRAGASHPQAGHMFISGGYDGKINLYDARVQQSITRTLDHGSPVESMLFLPKGSIFITAGGTQTVTCLRVGSDGRRLLSGGLDRHVKIYDVGTYKTVYTLTYPKPVVSLGIAARNQALVAGMVDGLVSIKRMIVDSKPSHLELIKATHRQTQRNRMARPNTTANVDHVVTDQRRMPQLTAFENHLRKYNYKKALDSVLVPKNTEDYPEQIVAVITELLHRSALQAALTNRNEATLIQFIDFLCAHIGEVLFMRPLLNAARTVMDVFENNVFAFSKDMFEALERLRRTMQAEIRLTMELVQLKCALEMIIEGALDNNEDDATKVRFTQSEVPKMHPSLAASNYVVLVD